MSRDAGPGRPIRLTAQMTRADFAYLQGLLLRRAGLVLEAGKEYLAETRLATLAQQEGFESVAALLDALHVEDGQGLLHRRVVEAMAIAETSFFRDLHPFEALRRQVIPELVARREGERALSFWSAACSSGQEPYSLAMLLREHFPQLGSWNVRILATDLSSAMLARARAARFTQVEVNRGLPAAMLVKYFERDGSDYRLRDEVRGMVEFRELNLISPFSGIPPMDLILLRNVLLYFGTATRKAVLKSVAKCLRPDGCLLLGGGETTLMLDDSFEPVLLGRAICYRPGGKESPPAAA